MSDFMCHRCKNSYDFSNVSYSMVGGSRVLLCNGCQGKDPVKEDVTAAIFGRDEPKEEVKEKTEENIVSTDPMNQGPHVFNYQCVKCKFTFKRPSSKKMLKCPNCDGSELLKYSKVDADALLRFADDSSLDR